MKIEISAGGVIIRKKSNGKWEVLLMRDMNGNWTFPKGLIGKGEKPEEAAGREIFEEIGLKNLSLIKKIDKIHYFYNRGGLINKTVHYFLFSTDGHESFKFQKEEGITDAKWMSLSEAQKNVGYAKTNAPLLLKVKEFLSTYHGN